MKKLGLVIFAALLLWIPAHVYAAELFFGTHSKEVGEQETFQIGVFVNTSGQEINAVEGEIDYPADSLELKDIYTGNSLVNFWVKQPAGNQKGAVSFAGIVPGGFSGAQGYLFSLVFKAVKQGNAAITTSQENILLNDGAGTPVAVTKAPLAIEVTDKPSATFIPPADLEAPESFELSVGQDKDALEGGRFLVFAAQDKGSGIDHYEILETPPWWSYRYFAAHKTWVTGQSPYVLQDQSLQSDIAVKAIDKSGNTRLATLKHLASVPWYENYLLWIVAVVILGVVIKRSIMKK